MVRGKFSLAKLYMAKQAKIFTHAGDRITTDSVGKGVKNLSVAW